MLVTLPYKILVDKDVKTKIAGTIKSLNVGKKCTVISSSRIQKIVGKNILDEISSSFDVNFIEPVSSENGHIKSIVGGIKTDFIIGIGGGRTIDIAKYIAHLSGKPWIAFPTILSHDGVVSSRAVLENNGSKISLDASEPSAIIADLNIIKKADYNYLAAGIGDLISNFSAVEDWKLAEKAGKENYHEIMAKLSLVSAEAAAMHISNIKKKDYHGLEILFWSLVSAGFAMNIYGSSRPCSGSEHNISHALDKLGSEALHGKQVALCTIVSVYLQKGDWKKIRELMIKAGLPTSAKDLKIENKMMVEALVNARKIRNRYTVLDRYSFTKASAEKVLKKTQII